MVFKIYSKCDEQDSSPKLLLTSVLINTVKEAPSLPTVRPILTTNGFLYKHNYQTYIVTTAHTFFAESQTPSTGDDQMGTMQNTIQVSMHDGKEYLDLTVAPKDVYYSRTFDVAFIPIETTLTTVTEFSLNNRNGDMCFIPYTDTLSRTEQCIQGKYLKIVQGQVDMFAVTAEGSTGTSGTPVVSNNRVVGMVSSCSGGEGAYTNMSLCVPSNTIKRLLETITPSASKDLDDSNLFTGAFYQLVEPSVSMYVDSEDGELKKLLRNSGGQRVIYSDRDSRLYPWDIVTGATINGKHHKVGAANSMSKLLLNNKVEEMELDVYRIAKEYFYNFLNITDTIYCTEHEDPDGGSKFYCPVSEITQKVYGNKNIIEFSNLKVSDDLFYIGQQLSYVLWNDDSKYKKFDRSYATIIDIKPELNSVIINKELAEGSYCIGIVPIGQAGYVLHNSPTKYDEDGNSDTVICFPDEGSGDIESPDGMQDDLTNEQLHKLKVTNPDFKLDTLNTFVIQSFTNMLFLMVSQVQCSVQEKINIIETEFEILWKKLVDIYGDVGIPEEKLPLTSFIEFNFLYTIFYANCVSRFGNDAITMFNAIPDPPVETADYWRSHKEESFGDLYSSPVSTFASSMEERDAFKNGFNNSIFNTENGWFYGTVSDRAGQNVDFDYGSNIASQQLEMILDDLVTHSHDHTKLSIHNITSVNYLMELAGVSWNNLLIADNYRKRNKLESKLKFTKI